MITFCFMIYTASQLIWNRSCKYSAGPTSTLYLLVNLCSVFERNALSTLFNKSMFCLSNLSGIPALPLFAETHFKSEMCTPPSTWTSSFLLSLNL